MRLGLVVAGAVLLGSCGGDEPKPPIVPGGGASGGASGASGGAAGASGGAAGAGGGGAGGASGGASGASGGAAGWRGVVGAEGAYARTHDDTTWEVTRPARGDLYAVTCIGDEYGWAVGAGGVILSSRDGGATWTAQTSPVTTALRGVRFFDALSGVAVGDDGTVIVTRDGGQSWTPRDVGTAAALRAVGAAPGGRVAWVVGDAGTVLLSEDQAETFRRVATDVTLTLHGASIDTLGRGYAVGERGRVLRLEGTTATQVAAPTSVTLRAVDVADAGGGEVAALVVGDGGNILVRGAGLDDPFRRVGGETSADLYAALVTVGGDGTRLYVAGAMGTLLEREPNKTGFRRLETGVTGTWYGLEDF